MPFDYRNHYAKLISELTNAISKSIEEMPDSDKDLYPDFQDKYNNGTESKPVQYGKKKNNKKPLYLDES